MALHISFEVIVELPFPLKRNLKEVFARQQLSLLLFWHKIGKILFMKTKFPGGNLGEQAIEGNWILRAGH